MAYVVDEDNLLLCAIVTIVMQLSFFCVATTFKFDKVTDFAGGSNFVLLAILTFVMTNTYETRQILVTGCVVVWGVRLAGFLLYRILKLGKDDRFDGKRENFLQFLVFWIFQMLWVFIVSLPVIFVNSGRLSKEYFPTGFDIVGGILWLVGFVIETFADFQKFFFKENPDNRNKWCNIGLWSVSRHPNYFGEITLWWGIFLIGVSIYKDVEYIAILSPVFTMAILLFLSGLPLLEKSSDKKWGADARYREYKNKTSILIPMPTRFYAAFPDALKQCFCEFSCYKSYENLDNRKVK